MKTIRILKLVTKRAWVPAQNSLAVSFAIGVALANAAVCLVDWQPFHFALAIFASLAAVLLAAFPDPKGGQNRRRTGQRVMSTRWPSRTCRSKAARITRFSLCQTRRIGVKSGVSG